MLQQSPRDDGHPPADGIVDFSYSILETPEAIAAEAPAWNRIVDEAYEGNPFLTADWFLLWLRHFKPKGSRVCFVKVQRRREAVAYFPFLLATERFHGIDVRALRFAGNVYSPVQCPVIAPGEGLAAFEHVVRKALPELPWTLFLADGLPLEFAGPAELHAALGAAGHESHLVAGEANWVYSIQGETGRAYLEARDQRLRRPIRRGAQRLAELGRVEVRVAAGDVTEDDIAAYRDVYAKSWKEPELDVAFHPALMRWAAERGTLRLFSLRVDGRPIAAQIWLVHARRAYGLKFAYDEEHRPRAPGNVLMAGAIERLIDADDVCLVDFLKGDDPYKKDWCNRRRQRMSLIAFSRDVRGLAARFLDQELLPWVRRQPALASAKRYASSLLGRAGAP